MLNYIDAVITQTKYPCKFSIAVFIKQQLFRNHVNISRDVSLRL